MKLACVSHFTNCFCVESICCKKKNENCKKLLYNKKMSVEMPILLSCSYLKSWNGHIRIELQNERRGTKYSNGNWCLINNSFRTTWIIYKHMQ